MPPANSSSSTIAGPPPGKGRTLAAIRLVGMLFLATQIAFVLVTHLSPDNPRLLTPVEGFTRYDLNASYRKHLLRAKDIRSRYGIPARDDVSLEPAAIQGVIHHREKPIPLSRATFVRLRTRHNGGPEEFWLWPQE